MDPQQQQQQVESLGQRFGVWFKEAQQSLSLAGPICTEANSLVTTSRKQIEQATSLWTQVRFVPEAIDQQLNRIKAVEDSLDKAQGKGNEELNRAINDLREMEETLDASLRNLENTQLDPGFITDDNNHGKKNLRSFVFEDGIEKLKHTIKEIIDASKHTQTQASEDLSKIHQETEDLTSKKIATSIQEAKDKSLENAHQGADVIASNAHSMAELLESLTRHYDQCMTAVDMSQKTPKTHRQSNSELDELLSVLENDSQQVEDVVNELYGHRKAIEASEKSVSDFYNSIQARYTEVVDYFEVVDQFTKSKLPGYLKTLDGYSQKQKYHVEEISGLIKELSSLVEYYDIFLNSYHALILEIGRRTKAEQKMQSIIDDMSKTLSRFRQEEVEARKEFINDRGNYLPNDLWSGLTDNPSEAKIEFDQSNTNKLPTISEESIQKAKKEIKL